MKLRFFNIICFFLISIPAFAQSEMLQSGPMVGYSGFREVLIWVQTSEAASVKIGYYSEGETERFTKSVQTEASEDFIAKLYPHEVDYGKTYTYKLYINDKYVPRNYPLKFQTQPLWQFRTDPPDFSFAIGSCLYINEIKDDRAGKPYAEGYSILNEITKKQPDFMVWLGDNIYLRTPDFLTDRGIRHRYKHVRKTPELQPLLGGMHHYATWDDHDYGPNDADISYVNKYVSAKAFDDYWGNLNTNVTKEGGITNQFVWNDVEFFMLDNRFHRDPNEQKTTKQYFGKAQIDWLIKALRFSKAPFKIVCSGGQIINDAALYENYANYAEERQTLLKRLDEEQIEGVIFLSGDRHHTEISKMQRKNAYPLIDITCSPLTAGIHKARDEGNTYQLKKKTYYKHNFGIIDVTGPRKDRRLKLTIFDKKGKKVWDYNIKASELKYPKG